MKRDCTGQCVAGVIIAIIFGALFLWTLVLGYQTQVIGRNVSAFVTYALALVFLVIAKVAKCWGKSCTCGCAGGMCAAPKPVAGTPGRRVRRRRH
ncbi:MAG: hypothetical protein KKA90_03565 [Nanoarchaeota archaeon]|nr:hypothetical protein [Nanoarchaeota archaeon]